MPRFRQHRALLSEAMETACVLRSREELVALAKEEFRRFGVTVVDKDVKVEMYDREPDDRIGWDCTYIVTVRGHGVFGFSDGPFSSGKR